MLFYLFYSIFIICSTIYTVQNFGYIFTPRQVSTLIMFFLCLLKEKKLWVDKFWLLYCGFIIFFGLSCIIDGYELRFITRLVGDYFVAYVAYWSSRLVAKNKKLKYLFIPLFLSVGFNAIVSYSQLIGNDFLQPFLERFRLIADERYYYYYEREISLMGKVTFGIYSSPVVSGHMLMYVAVLSMIFQQRRINFFAIFLTLLLLIGSFATQERTGFYTAIAMILFLMYIKITLMNNSSKYFLIFLFIVGVLLFIPWFFNMLMEGESRYAEKGFDTTGRDVIYLESFNYFLDHPLLGGYYNYMESHTFPPHNVLLNSLVYSGVLGTFFIISIFVLQMKKIFSIIRNANKCNYGLLVISTAYISIILNGFTHNISIVNADINGWIIWGVINYSIYNRNKTSYLTT